MEYFILLGGVLSVPIIYYTTLPVEISKETLAKEDEDHQKTETTPLDQEKLETMKKNAQARKDKILSALNPEEQALFKEYINGIITAKPSGYYEKCFSFVFMILGCFVFVLLVNAIIESRISFEGFDL
jgi:Flp pilus assembly protein TadB